MINCGRVSYFCIYFLERKLEVRLIKVISGIVDCFKFRRKLGVDFLKVRFLRYVSVRVSVFFFEK